ncbi:DMT family transporter [Desulfuribacillus alkaliarsenatis]|uniref:EamA domain-containing protein n=1 Tax=Desulfuribacillus alkaliarsenatis TaxID=766136 RepID=A0A1E5FYD7_9FIRM|nr:DMT family transporter [Desulfuribacillus alkaliarsenatis]OEF95584.1 hypothetical protein BHF68_12075 [Desulfuribacillus alkaliarsenatis]
MKLDSTQRTYLLLILSTFIWGSAFIAAKISVEELHPITVAFFRFLGASIALWWFMSRREPVRPKLQKKDLIIFTVLGLIGIFGYNVLFFYGVMLTTITKSSLIIATNPIVITILSILFLKERLSLLQAFGISLGIIGAFTIITEGSLQTFLQLGVAPVDFILLGAVFCWAIYSVVGRVSLNRFSPLVATTYACVAGTIFLLPFGIAKLTIDSLAQTTVLTWLSILHMAVIVSALSFVLWYDGIKKVGAARAASFINLMPVSAIILASIIFNEKISPIQLAGAALILFGVYLTNRKAAPSSIRKSSDLS